MKACGLQACRSWAVARRFACRSWSGEFLLSFFPRFSTFRGGSVGWCRWLGRVFADQSEEKQLNSATTMIGNLRNARLLPLSIICFGLTVIAHVSSFAAGPEPVVPPAPKWESIAAADISLTRGNSSDFLGTFSLNTKKKWTSDEVLLGGAAGYGETHPKGKDETTTQDYLKGFGQWNHLFTERIYGGLRLEGLHDDIANVDYRFTVSPLAGYYLIKETNTFLAVEAGPSWVHERLFVAGGTDVERSYFALRFAERFEYKFEHGARIWETAELIPSVEHWADYIFNFEAGVSAPITKSLDVRLVVQDTYDNKPAPHRLKNDFKLGAGFGYRF